MSGPDRPRTYAPRGTSLGIVGFLLTSAAIPPDFAEAAAPWLHDPTETVGWSILGGGALSMLLFVPVVAALRARKYWFICYFFCVGSALVVTYALVLCLGLAHLFGGSGANHIAFNTVGLVTLLITAPAPLLLIRMLRLKYWQPWTAPAEWERGDERAPAWAVAATGIGASASAVKAAPTPPHKRRARPIRDTPGR